jgi:hypothetical protein
MYRREGVEKNRAGGRWFVAGEGGGCSASSFGGALTGRGQVTATEDPKLAMSLRIQLLADGASSAVGDCGQWAQRSLMLSNLHNSSVSFLSLEMARSF